MMKTAVRNWRYKLNKLKQDHFDPFPLHLVTKTSPVKSTSDAQRMELVEMWKTPKKMEVCQKNKDNLGKVKFHQKTGSCSYPVFVENLEDKDQEKDKEPDALKLFKACHYNKKTKGFTPAVQSVIQHNQQKVKNLSQMFRLYLKCLTRTLRRICFFKMWGCRPRHHQGSVHVMLQHNWKQRRWKMESFGKLSAINRSKWTR